MWGRTGHGAAVPLGELMAEPVTERSARQRPPAVLPEPDAASRQGSLPGNPAPGIPSAAVQEGMAPQAVAAKAAHENFPVALRMLPRTYREHLMAVYVFARTADDLGDQAPAAERLALLAGLEADPRRLYAGPDEAGHRPDGGMPVQAAVAGLARTV